MDVEQEDVKNAYSAVSHRNKDGSGRTFKLERVMINTTTEEHPYGTVQEGWQIKRYA